MIDRVIFYSVWTVQRVELHLGNDVEWTMIVSDVDDAVIGVTYKDLANIRSDVNARTLRNINEPNNLVELRIEDNDISIDSRIEIGVV